LEKVKCICSSEDYNLLYRLNDPSGVSKQFYPFVKCSSCGLVYINLRPSDEELKNLYDEYYSAMKRPLRGIEGNLIKFFNRIRIYRIFGFKKLCFFSRGTYHAYTFLTSCQNLYGEKSRKILDIGCGDGSFLVHLKEKGWDVFGVETSRNAVLSARERNRLDIFCGDLKDANFPSGFFDVLTMWHVLEHIPYPIQLLAEVKRVMKNGGLLFISVPDIESIQAKVCKGKWFHMDPPRHLYQYSPGTLNAILERGGFKIMRVSHSSGEYDAFGWFQSILNMLLPEMNILYYWLNGRIKRVDSRRNSKDFGSYLKKVWAGSIILISIIPVSILSILLTCLCGIFKSGGSLSVWCTQNGKEDIIDSSAD